MNTNALARNYDTLSPLERFKLILSAGARDDEAEQDRLVNAGRRISLSMPEHSPYAHAFDELSTFVFIELLEDAGVFLDAFVRSIDACDIDGAVDTNDDEDGEPDRGDEEEELTPETSESDGGNRPAWVRSLGIVYAAGFVLRTKVKGWESYCEQMLVPPFALWRLYPGLYRLQRALALAEKSSFDPESMLHWLNSVRSAGESELSALVLTVEKVIADHEETFRQRVAWWGG